MAGGGGVGGGGGGGGAVDIAPRAAKEGRKEEAVVRAVRVAAWGAAGGRREEWASPARVSIVPEAAVTWPHGDVKELSRKVALPDDRYPSDHLPLLVRLRLVPR